MLGLLKSDTNDSLTIVSCSMGSMDMAGLPVVVMSGSSVFTSKISDEVVGASSLSTINGSPIKLMLNLVRQYVYIYI